MEISRHFIEQAVRHLRVDYLPRIRSCLALLTDEQIWWRPNDVSNSVGNLVLHLCGNLEQWMVATLGGKEDTRRRREEFESREKTSGPELLEKLESTVKAAAEVMEALDSGELLREFDVQIYRVTGLQAVFHAVEHFSCHTGQICYITKQLTGRDLNFYPDLA